MSFDLPPRKSVHPNNVLEMNNPDNIRIAGPRGRYDRSNLILDERLPRSLQSLAMTVAGCYCEESFGRLRINSATKQSHGREKIASP